MARQLHTVRVLLALTLIFLFPLLTLASPPPRQHPTTSSHHLSSGLTTRNTTAAEVIAALNLTTNAEKGYYVQTFEDPASVTFTASTSGSNGSAVVSYETTRSASTAIYYLLEGAEGDSLWHRIDAVEVWHYYAGAPMRLRLSYDDGRPATDAVLGPDLLGGERPQLVIGKWQWQSARSLGDWTLVGTTVAPAFSDDAYEIQAEGWQPNETTTHERRHFAV